MNRFLVFTLALALSAPCACRTTHHVVPAGSSTAAGYRVVVAIVVDQLAAWVMAERAQELPARAASRGWRAKGSMRANWSSSTLLLRPRPGTRRFSLGVCRARTESTRMKFSEQATLKLCPSCVIAPRVWLLSTVPLSKAKAVRLRPCIRTWPRLLTSGGRHIPMYVFSVSR